MVSLLPPSSNGTTRLTLLFTGHVAQELRAWIAAAGYKAKVTGGGWIDHDPKRRTVSIFGTSHAFGRADHAATAMHIRSAYPDYEVTDDDGLL